MFVVLVLAALVLLNLCLNEKYYKIIGIPLSFLLIFSIFAFRNEAGVDDQNYIYYYKLIANGEIRKFFAISAVEDSFYYIAQLSLKLGGNYKMLFSIYAFIGTLFLYLISTKCKLNKKEYLIFFLIFLAFGALPYVTIMRQFPAAMIGIYATILFNENKYIRSILLLMFAMFLHNSSIIFVFAFLFSKIGLFKYKILYVLFPLLAWIFNISGLFYKLMEIILKGTPYYRHFLDINEDTFGGTSIVVILMFLIYCILIYVIPRKNLEKKEERVLVLFQMIFFSLYFVTQNMGVLGRMYDYFIIFQAFSFLLLYKCTKKDFKNLFLILITLFLSFLVVYNFGITYFDRFNINGYSIKIIGGVEK